MESLERFKQEVLKDGPRLGRADTFCFQCDKSVSCFNECCHDVNIFLTPYDIIRIKRRLGLDSGEFLRRHAIVPFGPGQKYPVVVLKMRDDERKSCPFLSDPDGCAIYEDRPWACRMYPLGMAAAPKEEPKDESFFFLLRESFCRGGESGLQWTVAEWLDNQGVEEYDRAGHGFQQIVQRSQTAGAPDLSPEAMDMLFMVCYDLDRFRRFVFETRFLNTFEMAEHTVDAIRSDDKELLDLGLQWIRFGLWRDPTLKIRDEVIRAKKAQIGA